MLKISSNIRRKIHKDKYLRADLSQFIHCKERQRKGICEGCDADIDIMIDFILEATEDEMKKV